MTAPIEPPPPPVQAPAPPARTAPVAIIGLVVAILSVFAAVFATSWMMIDAFQLVVGQAQVGRGAAQGEAGLMLGQGIRDACIVFAIVAGGGLTAAALCGLTAIRQIRSAGGSLCGAGLAAFDMFLLPSALLFVATVVAALLALPVIGWPVGAVAVVALLLGNYVLVLWIWPAARCAARRPPGGPDSR